MHMYTTRHGSHITTLISREIRANLTFGNSLSRPVVKNKRMKAFTGWEFHHHFVFKAEYWEQHHCTGQVQPSGCENPLILICVFGIEANRKSRTVMKLDPSYEDIIFSPTTKCVFPCKIFI